MLPFVLSVDCIGKRTNVVKLKQDSEERHYRGKVIREKGM